MQTCRSDSLSSSIIEVCYFGFDIESEVLSTYGLFAVILKRMS